MLYSVFRFHAVLLALLTSSAIAFASDGTPSDVKGTTMQASNPLITGGLLGEGDATSQSTHLDSVTLSGKRTKAVIARSIAINDNQVGPESGASNPTPQSASYGLSITGNRPNWHRSALTGEMNGISVLLRQARSDTAALLTNVGVQHGFAATIESVTFAADLQGAPARGVNTQLGVANSRDNAFYGLVVQSAYGANLPGAGIRISSIPGTSWARPLEIVDASGSDVLYVNGADGRLLTNSVAPRTQYGGDLGGPGQEFGTSFNRLYKLTPINFASLPACNLTNAGYIARINDAKAAITTFNQVVSKGGGRNTAMISCSGTEWRALSS